MRTEQYESRIKWPGYRERFKNPITAEELEYIREHLQLGDAVYAKSYHTAESLGKGYGEWVKGRVIYKSRWFAVLDNGLTVTYVELAERLRGRR